MGFGNVSVHLLTVTSSVCPSCPRLVTTILLGVLADPEDLGDQAGCVLPPLAATPRASSFSSPFHFRLFLLLSILLIFLSLLLLPSSLFHLSPSSLLFPSFLSFSSLEEIFFDQQPWL